MEVSYPLPAVDRTIKSFSTDFYCAWAQLMGEAPQSLGLVARISIQWLQQLGFQLVYLIKLNGFRFHKSLFLLLSLGPAQPALNSGNHWLDQINVSGERKKEKELKYNLGSWEVDTIFKSY